MRTSRACRTDDNHKEIMSALRRVGCSVLDTSGLPKFVDIVAGRNGVNYLLEVKDGSKPPSKRRLTRDQVTLHDEWRGQIAVVTNVAEAFAVVGVHGE